MRVFRNPQIIKKNPTDIKEKHSLQYTEESHSWSDTHFHCQETGLWFGCCWVFEQKYVGIGSSSGIFHHDYAVNYWEQRFITAPALLSNMACGQVVLSALWERKFRINHFQPWLLGVVWQFHRVIMYWALRLNTRQTNKYTDETHKRKLIYLGKNF